ncbi:DUF6044 family protein [Ectobacillus funiculus]
MVRLKAIQDKEHIAIIVAFFFILLYVSPLFILGEDAHIRVHDNMDSNIAWYKVLIDSGQLFGSVNATIPQIINGLPRNAFDSQFSGIVWLHALFPTMIAYAISQAITRIVAFIGMYMLLTYVVKERDMYLIRVGVSAAFALTPFWPSGMLSTLGHPLALWAFLNIRKKSDTWREWTVLALLPFYSSFVLGFFFFLAAMGVLWLYDVITIQKRNWKFFGSITFMTAIFLGTGYRLVYSLIAGGEPMSRNEFLESTLNVWQTMRLAFKNYAYGHTHVMTLHTVVILPVSFVVLVIIAIKNSWGKGQGQEKRFVFLSILNVMLSIWYACWFYKGWQPIKDKISFLNTFNFSRFHFLRPLVIYVSFAIALSILWRLGTRWKKVVAVCLVLQLCILGYFNEEIHYSDEPSFRQFYSEHLFQEIKNYIGKPQQSYRVASIGLHPAIAQYNGFYTVDTYTNFYPLSYKYQFRAIIAKELDKSPVLKDYYDHWGNRVYVFVAELGKHYEFRKNSKKKIYHLDINTKAFEELGGQYIFSSVPIVNAQANHLKFLKDFTDSQSVWKIYLYQAE